MNIAATNLDHLPVLDPDTHSRIGMVEACIFDADRGSLAGLRLKKNGVILERLYVTINDIQSFESHAILCTTGHVSTLDELPKLEQILKSKRPILGQHVYTVNRVNIGRVVEILFDDISGHIMQYHTRHLFAKFQFRSSDVVRITKKALIVKSDVVPIKSEVLASGTQPA